ncbi:caspase domain-containing protein [Mycena rosella]|uniref:Caspase domain-containing protein n=1 Tax=Mycena rosella TaxID=1033263 RepID=A0AAD7D9S9_MYCRO|nr:caspase domain-containing protein [Mycena rosella]
MKIGRTTVPPPRRAPPTPSPLSAAAVPRAPLKKALLIAISAAGPGYAPLAGPHGDVLLMRTLLLERYGYAARDVVTLSDEPGVGAVQPTRVNILAAIAELVRGARSGDRFFFHYCGHTTQTPNRTNSEEDGMDECLVPADGEPHKITDNELRAALVEPLPVGAALVAVFDSCHSASLLDLAHFRCNRVYVPWVNKGRRRSDERWNAVVRRHAMPLLPVSKPPSRTNTSTSAHPLSPLAPVPPIPALAHVSPLSPDAKPPPRPTRRATRRATRELRELVQLMEDARADVPTRPNSPASPEAPTPMVTTRRIYEAARTSARTVRAWRTEVDALEVREDDALEVHEDEAVAVERAGTEGEAQGRDKRRRGKRASLPLLPVRLGSLRERDSKGKGKGKGKAREKEEDDNKIQGKQRRTTVTRARAVSIAVGKENADAGAGAGVGVGVGAGATRPTLKVAVERTGRPVSWFEEMGEGAEGRGRACESPERVWPCQGDCRESSHGHDGGAAPAADVISLASCKDHQFSWEDAEGGSMTRELVRILEREPHPTLRALVTRVSHALHRLTLERHWDTRRWKRECKAYEAEMRRLALDGDVGGGGGGGGDVDAAPTLTSGPSRTSTLSLEPSSRTASVAPPSPALLARDTRAPVKVQAKAKSEGFVDPPVSDYEMDNFQNPEVASHRPLDMDRPWSI